LVAPVRGFGIAVALRSQVVFDPIGGVLEQILVHRSFAFNRHQLRSPVGRELVAGEHDTDVRAGRNRQGQVDRACAFAGCGRRSQLGFVISRLPLLNNVSFDSRVERVGAVNGANSETQVLEQSWPRHRRRTDDVDRADHSPGTWFDCENQCRPVW
jgi:hypothetical protein